MLEFVKGDFFDFDADVRINTVNCVGVMGAGVALAFKTKYPDMFKDYVKQCKNGQIKPGYPYVWKTGDMFSKGIEIVNFPTKDHWRKPSEYEYVESGLLWLSEYLSDREGLIITLPALGCGHGGLDWGKVKILIKRYLGGSSHKILVFEPASSKNIGKNASLSKETVQNLLNHNIEIINESSESYPEGLKRYTEKNLYFFGEYDLRNGFDVSIISSSRPSDNEKNAISKLVNYCKQNKLSILFGGTAFDKKLALRVANEGNEVGTFLPSGILDSTDKLIKKSNIKNLTLLSIGDPIESYDRKAYIPSVLSRMFMSKVVVFTTDRLAWIEKQKKIIMDGDIRSFFICYPDLTQNDKNAVEKVYSCPIEIKGDIVDFEMLKS